MAKLSIIIPHKNRHPMLTWHLNELANQSLLDFEVIIVDDHSDTPLPDLPSVPYMVQSYQNPLKGPAAARNFGAIKASSDTVLFVGDDCIPDKHLVFRHAYKHACQKERIAVQGFSPFHPQIMGTEFMQWLDKSGLQANWKVMKNDDGSIIDWQNGGFCLTTNFSINRRSFLDLGGFDHRYFPDAAWEDIALGYNLTQFGVRSRFEPKAINYHYHPYTLETFVKRQMMVGRNVWNLALKHSELIAHQIDPEGLRYARTQKIKEWLHAANSIKYASNTINPIQQAKSDTWGQVIQTAFLIGALQELDKRGKYWKVFEHVHKNESVVFALEAIRGIKDNNFGWSMHNLEWLIQSAPDNWAVYCFQGEILKEWGLEEEAQNTFKKSYELAPHNWTLS